MSKNAAAAGTIKNAIKTYEKQNIPASFYIHSWELTPEHIPKINLPKKYSNISRIRLVSTEFPNTEQVIRSQPVSKKNNKIYWKNFDDGDVEYSITITDGNYTSNKFSNELQNKNNYLINRFFNIHKTKSLVPNMKTIINKIVFFILNNKS